MKVIEGDLQQGERRKWRREWTVQKIVKDVDESAATARTVEDAADAEDTDGSERCGRRVTAMEGR